MKEKEISLGVIGVGHWGPNHVRNFIGLPNCRVAVVADSNKEALARVSKQFPGPKTVQDYKKLLAGDAIDAVVVCTPTSTHYKIVRGALAAGKHVLCEKPLSETGAQAKDLVRLAKAKKRVLMVGHVFVFNPGLLKVKEIIDSGETGKIYYLSAVRTNLGPIRTDINVAYDLASHDISIFNFLLGKTPLSVSASGMAFLQPGIEDVTFISLRYPGDVIASVQTSWLNPKKVRQLTVVGSRKMVTWDDLELVNPVAIYDRGAGLTGDYRGYGEFLRIATWDGEVRLPKVSPEEPLKVQDRAFLDAVLGRAPVRSSGEFAAGVVEALEAARKSLRRRGAPVEL
ncbi:MAG: Gfo/Idh/MocA family oxidoreductase [Elusimicrobia bacterium]|nr:Gfo/Idh/MocA family oxidoreductase [Elusimicrobiota bacterium]